MKDFAFCDLSLNWFYPLYVQLYLLFYFFFKILMLQLNKISKLNKQKWTDACLFLQNFIKNRLRKLLNVFAIFSQ